VWRKAAVNDDSASNGGRMTATVIPSGTKNNIWPDVPQAERLSGSTKYRKVFIHVANDDDLTLINPRLFVSRPTPGDDAVVIFPGSFTDDQTAASAYSGAVYGGGILDASVLAGATQLYVMTEGQALGCFQPGMKIFISNTEPGGGGTEEYAAIAAGGVSYSGGDVALITVTAPIANPYSAGATRVSSVYEPGSIVGSFTNFAVTSVGGSYNKLTHPIEVDSIGGVFQNWTITFTSATNYTITADTPGVATAVSGYTGSRSADFSPVNPDFAKPYFTLRKDGFSGTFVAGNTITFRTVPAAVPVWYKRIIPAAAGSLSGNYVTVAVDGESE